MSGKAPPLPDISCVFGPTASGKTAFAIQLANRVNGCIINADSMQVYAGLRDITARPDAAEEAQAPHRLYGILTHDQACNAVIWAKMATREIRRCMREGQHPILVGGTGLYFRALLDGLSPSPPVAPSIATAVRQMTGDRLDTILKITGETRLTDPQRKQRAAGVYLSSGRSLAHWQAIPPAPCPFSCDFHILWPERDRVYARINRRFAQMINDGNAIDEVAHLLSLNPAPDSPVMRAIGVPEIRAYLAGGISKDAAIAAAQQATRRYAKRQFTWMRATQAGFKTAPAGNPAAVRTLKIHKGCDFGI